MTDEDSSDYSSLHQHSEQRPKTAVELYNDILINHDFDRSDKVSEMEIPVEEYQQPEEEIKLPSAIYEDHGAQRVPETLKKL